MSAKEVKADRKYTKDHEWARLADGVLTVGITAFAVDQLGDITLVNFDVAVGDKVREGAAFGTIESVKTLSDLFAPVNGTVLALNPKLDNQPELINEDCWEAGWMLQLKCDADLDVAALLDDAGYLAHVASSEH
ncbi:MAG: hypothetical protein RJA70_4594 [Pseudomonadota bacterium]|jgi:glycine cleavage system H protein